MLEISERGSRGNNPKYILELYVLSCSPLLTCAFSTISFFNWFQAQTWKAAQSNLLFWTDRDSLDLVSPSGFQFDFQFFLYYWNFEFKQNRILGEITPKSLLFTLNKKLLNCTGLEKIHEPMQFHFLASKIWMLKQNLEIHQVMESLTWISAADKHSYSHCTKIFFLPVNSQHFFNHTNQSRWSNVNAFYWVKLKQRLHQKYICLLHTFRAVSGSQCSSNSAKS